VGIRRLADAFGSPSDHDSRAQSPLPTSIDGCETNFAARTVAVTDECCNQPDEDCSTGIPASCNAGCAALVIPYFVECSKQLGTQAAAFGDLTDMCQAALMTSTGRPCNLAARVDAVNAECCDELNEDCSLGIPSSCNLGCATLALPFFADCGDDLSEHVHEYDSFISDCETSLTSIKEHQSFPSQTSTSSVQGFSILGDGVCRGNGGACLESKVKDFVADANACATECVSLPGLCNGFAYSSPNEQWPERNRCFLYGPGISAGLPLVTSTIMAEWHGENHEANEISQASGSMDAVCYKQQ
jgi:hypothetical protein